MERIHIAVIGPVNSGKSTLVNALCGQEVSLVSPVAGTTTDPVRKAVELPGLGACVIIDTPGLEDESPLGPERMRRTLSAMDEADILVQVIPPSQIVGRKEQKPTVFAPSVHENGTVDTPTVVYTPGEPVQDLIERIREALPVEEKRFLTGDLVKPGDKVVLVMPQDSEAPKGRIILPQVQVLRELLDRGCIPVCCTPETLRSAMEVAPSLVITDSQVFGEVDAAVPKDTPLTSFSVLLAANKGDINVFVQGARAIERLRPGDRVLIAEACTHVPNSEDIGRVKIPAMLQRIVSPSRTKTFSPLKRSKKFCPTPEKNGLLTVDIAAGNDFPEDLSQYALIIHCGACVASSALVRARIKKALRAGVPITNYGIAIAALQGILDRIAIPRIRPRSS